MVISNRYVSQHGTLIMATEESHRNTYSAELDSVFCSRMNKMFKDNGYCS